MLNELWEHHRAGICSAVGAALFLICGMIAGFGPSEPKDEPMVQRQEPAVRHRQTPKEAVKSIPVPRAPYAKDNPMPPTPPKTAGEVITVHITGHVKNPGVYCLPPNSRIENLIKAAGGLDGFADGNAINMAQPLKNGSFIEIPYKWKATGKKTTAGSIAPQQRAKGKSKTSSKKWDERIDINSADEETLTHLRGIGPALSRRIVEYRREHGPFHSVDELINVKGIGSAKVNGLRGQAVVAP